MIFGISTQSFVSIFMFSSRPLSVACLVGNIHVSKSADTYVQRDALSTDYLNRYGEALMLIEMVLVDPTVIDDLGAWRPVSYVAHFRDSGLRCAAQAIASYEALPPLSRGAFEALCMAMNRLVETAILAVRETSSPEAAGPVIDIAAQAFRNLLTRAAAFINSGGAMSEAAYDQGELQIAIDQLMAA
jgi:hypothetical protein